MEEYCALFSRHRQGLLSQKAVQGEEHYRYIVNTTWEVSLKMIEDTSDEAGRDAIELLKIFSFLYHDGIGKNLFHLAWSSMQKNLSSGWMLSHRSDVVRRQKGQDWDFYPLRTAVSLLQSFSLINRDKDNLISILPLLHTWARDRLNSSDEDTM